MYVPIGVIYDQANLLENDAILEISVKTTQPPETFQMVDPDMVKAMFMQTVKEADYLKTKSDITNSMMVDEMPQLWRSITNSELLILIVSSELTILIENINKK